MSDTITMRWIDFRGREVAREINQVIDLPKMRGTPGYALLFIAANTHLSVSEILLFLETQGVERGRSWVQRRRWLFQPPGTVNSIGRPNRDGKDERAREIIREYPTASLRFI